MRTARTRRSRSRATQRRTPAEDPRELSSIARRVLGGNYRQHVDDATLRRALLAGYPDRVAQRREPKSPRLLLSSGTGATLAREIDDGNGEFLVVLDITGDLVRDARVVEREWLVPTHRESCTRAMEPRSRHRAKLVRRDPAARAERRAGSSRGGADSGGARETRCAAARRVAFAELDVDWPRDREAVAGKRSLEDVHIELPFRSSKTRRARAVDDPAPERPQRETRLSRRRLHRRLRQTAGAVRPRRTPRIGPPHAGDVRAPLPGGRPVQITQRPPRLLERRVSEVRKECAARYPKHPWPEDPWTAPADASREKAR